MQDVDSMCGNKGYFISYLNLLSFGICKTEQELCSCIVWWYFHNICGCPTLLWNESEEIWLNALLTFKSLHFTSAKTLWHFDLCASLSLNWGRKRGPGKGPKGWILFKDLPGEDEQGIVWSARSWNQTNDCFSMLGMISLSSSARWKIHWQALSDQWQDQRAVWS